MLLYMIRHGESVANHVRGHAGWGQVPLTSLGEEQARAIGVRLKGIVFDRIISSDLLRARQTCELALPGCSYEMTPLIREINVGSLSGKTAAECESIYGTDYLENKYQQDFTPYGGENREMLIERVTRFMTSAESFTEKTVAVFTHEGVLRVSMEFVTQAPRLRQRLYCGNCCIGVFEYLDGHWRLNAWNI